MQICVSAGIAKGLYHVEYEHPQSIYKNMCAVLEYGDQKVC